MGLCIILITMQVVFEPGNLPFHREKRSLGVDQYAFPTQWLSVGDGIDGFSQSGWPGCV